MPAKVETYLDLARETALGLSGSVDAWTAFLDTASRLYKYPFADQLILRPVHARQGLQHLRRHKNEADLSWRTGGGDSLHPRRQH